MTRSSVAVLCLLAFWCSVSAAANLNPVIMIPGDGGSQLEAKLNKTNVVHYLCARSADWYSLWLNVEQLVPEIMDCWADNMRLIYDNKTRTSRNNDGVQVRVPGFGNTTTVEYLDPSRISLGIYFGKIADKLVASLGYTRGKDLHGAPYDFRKAANEHSQFFSDLKALVETSYSSNGDRPVILLCHSMGSTMALYFLNHQSQSWKDKHIAAMVTLAGVWGGTVRALKVFAVGDNLGSYLVSTSSLMVEQRSSPSLQWLAPNDKFWDKDEVLVQSPELNVTSANLTAFYLGLGSTDAADMREDTKGLIHDLTPPGVPVYCMHGSKVPTTEKLTYAHFPSSAPTLTKGDGDGTVNIRSLIGCTRWQKQQKQVVHHKILPGLDHMAVLRDASAVEYVKDVVQAIVGKEDNRQMARDQLNEEMPRIEIIS